MMNDYTPAAPETGTPGETVHFVDGLPDMYTVTERQTEDGACFIVRLRGESLRWSGDVEAWYPTLEEAKQNLREFLGRMQ